MTQTARAEAAAACRALIDTRYPDGRENGAAAMILADGSILTGTAPSAVNPAVQVCHETEPFCGAHRLGQPLSPPSAFIGSRTAASSSSVPAASVANAWRYTARTWLS